MGIIKDIDKGGGEIIRIEVSEFKGIKYLNLKKRENINPLKKELPSSRSCIMS
jgi:hypothetical protein